MLGLLAAGEHVHGGAAGQRHLGGQVRTAAEAVDAQAAVLRELGPLEGAVADDAGAQQRGQFLVGVARREPVRVGGGHGHVLGVAAVGVPAGVQAGRAQVLGVAAAERAGVIGPAEPGGARAIAGPEACRVAVAHGRDLAHDLVAGGDAGAVRRQVALGHVQVGAADAAGQDPEQQLSGPWPRYFVFRVQAQRVAGDRSRRLDVPGSHTGTLLRARWP